MLFSTLRRGMDSSFTASSSRDQRDHQDGHGHRRRSLLVRRHTCHVLDPSKFPPGVLLLAPLGGELLGQVQVLDPCTDRVIAIKSLLGTPRGSVCVPLNALNSSNSSMSRSVSSSVLRRSATQRRRSQSRQGLLGMARMMASSALAPALLSTSPDNTGAGTGTAGGPPASAPPPLPALAASNSSASAPPPTYAFPPAFDPAPATAVHQKAPPLPGFNAWEEHVAPVVPPSFGVPAPPNSSTGPAPLAKTMSSTVTGTGTTTFDDDFDDEWSDEDEEVAHQTKPAHPAGANATNGRQQNRESNESAEEVLNESEAEQQQQRINNRAGAAQRQSLDVQSDLEGAETPSSPGGGKGVAGGQQKFTGANASNTFASSKMTGRSRSTGPDTSSISTASKQAGAGTTTRTRNLNRFSNFVRTGMESYILATAKFSHPPGERHEIVLTNGPGSRVEWHRPSEYYMCAITKPKKESKLKGLKSFIAYSLTCSKSGIQVSRRYKHFDWLLLQLSNKYLFIPVPPLPEKQVAGRYEEDLIEHRRSILQLWVNKICRHPVLGQSEVWRHFMGCTDEAKWKKGKRQAERDEYVGGNFFSCVSAPQAPLDSANVERQIDQFARCSRSLEESCRNMFERITETQKRLTGPYKGNWQKMGAAFDAVGQSLELDQSQPNNPVKNAIKTSAHVLHRIGAQHEEHGRRDLEQLLDFIFVTKGIVGAMPEIVNVHKSALAKMRENERLQAEGKISADEAQQIRQRVDTCSYAMLAEVQHQQEERDLDLATMFGAYFSQQAAFYHSIGNQLTQLAALYKPAQPK